MADRVTAVGPADGATAVISPAELTAKRRGPIRRYFHEHPLAMDFVIVAVYLLCSAGPVGAQLVKDNALPLGLALLSAALLMFRRYRPVPMIALLAVIETVLLLVEPLASNAGLSLWFGLYAVAVRHSRITSFVTTAAVSLPVVTVLLFVFRLPPQVAAAGGLEAALASVVTAVVVLLANVIATGVGLSVRRDREHELELHAWAERNALLASVSERNRIAREMHDVVAHSLTVMIALSDGAAVVVKRDPARAAEVLAELSRTGRTALADMRRVLGVLREDGAAEPVPRRPLPAQSGLEQLLEGFRTAGLPLSLAATGPALPADPAFQLTVYRIIQESLTNVLRYGHGVSRVQVQVLHRDPQVLLRIADDGHGTLDPEPSVGAGQGLVGMRERAGIYGGSVTAGPGADGGWVVEAVLTCPEGAGSRTAERTAAERAGTEQATAEADPAAPAPAASAGRADPAAAHAAQTGRATEG